MGVVMQQMAHIPMAHYCLQQEQWQYVLAVNRIGF